MAAIASLHCISNTIVDQPAIKHLAKEEEAYFPYLLTENNIDYLHVSCNQAAKLFKNKFPTKKKIFCQNIGIPLQAFPTNQTISNKKPVIVVASRNRPRKRIDLLTEIAKHNKKINFIVCGRGTMYESAEKNIISHGLVCKKELHNIMHKSDFTLSLSVHEIFANSLTEATCCGSIPIYPKIDPIQNDLFNKIGIPIKENEFISLNNKIKNLDILNLKLKAVKYAKENFDASKNTFALFKKIKIFN